MNETITTTALSVSFATVDGSTKNFRFNNVNPEATAAQIKNVVEAMITATSIFNVDLVMAKSAALITTETTGVDLD